MELRIEKLVSGCKGLARLPEGRAVLIDGALPGETVDLSPDGTFSILEASPDRRVPFCPYYGRCGGCDFQIVSNERSAYLKEEIVKENLLRLGKVPGLPPFLPPAYGPFLRYRHRARFHVSIPEGNAGFLAPRTNTLVPVESCPMLSSRLGSLLSDSRRLIAAARKKVIEGGAARNGLVSIPAFDGDDEVSLSSSPVAMTISGIKYFVSAEVFFQSNPGLLPELLSFVKENAKGEVIMDLYSGVGTFSALFDGNVYAVERDKACLALSRRNAPKAHSFTSDVALWTKRKALVPSTVIVDPPRTGLSGKALSVIASWKSPRIIYVSCDSATAARDIGRLDAYMMTKARVFDFYPGSSHEESAFVLDRVKGS